MRRALLLPLLLLASVDLGADVDVRQVQGRLDVRARGAPLSEVLDRLARQTGMKVVYEGPPPRQAVTADIEGKTAAEVLLRLFQGLGLNYAIGLDRTGVRVETLFVFPPGDAAPPGPALPSIPPRPAFAPSAPADDTGDEDPFPEEAPAAPPEGAPSPPPGIPSVPGGAVGVPPGTPSSPGGVASPPPAFSFPPVFPGLRVPFPPGSVPPVSAPPSSTLAPQPAPSPKA